MKDSIKHLEALVKNSKAIGETNFNGISTDSRNIKHGSLFVALKGERFDAHDFLPNIIDSGAVGVVAERIPENFPLPALIVPNTLITLGEIANGWRKQFNIPIVGVTGSNGKTTVKEMISSIFESAFTEEKRLTTFGNLNNEIGVPLTLFRLTNEHQAAVIEMGMNHPGEIERLSKIAHPTIGLVNNAQREHQEFMQTVEAVAIENGSVIKGLPKNGIAIFPGDDQYTEMWRDMVESKKVITFGLTKECDVRAILKDSESEFIVESPIGLFEVKLNTLGKHNVLNALAAISCSIAAGIRQENIIKGLANFEPVKGRLQKKISQCVATIIDDTYNANPDSVIAAINVLANTFNRKILVLGDMGEVGEQGEKFHKEIAQYAVSKNIDEILVVGELASYMKIEPKVKHFDNIEDLSEALNKSLKIHPKSTILVKGSRFMKMERVVEKLIS